MAQVTGRPTKYSEEIQAKADDYVFNHQSLVPTVAGLAIHLDIRRSTLYEWSKNIQEFSDTLDRLQERQEALLVDGGLGGEFNAGITKLMLSNHGYREKTEVDNKSSDGSMTPQKIERIIVQADNC